MSLPAQRYLVDDPEREAQGLRALIKVPLLAERLFAPLGLDAHFAWFLLRVKKQRLQASASGDVDLLAGPLEWREPRQFLSKLEEEKRTKEDWHPTWPPIFAALRLASEGGIRWPPQMNHLVAIEAKCVVNPRADAISRKNLKSTKTSKQKVRHTRAQVQDLLQMGFDRVALLDIIANPPTSGFDGQAWLIALDKADRSMREFLPDLGNRLPDTSAVGHFVWSSGAVVGGDESQRGAGSPIQLQPAIQNPLLLRVEVRTNRREVEENLRFKLAKIPAPLSPRFLLQDCSDCGQIHSGFTLCGRGKIGEGGSYESKRLP